MERSIGFWGLIILTAGAIPQSKAQDCLDDPIAYRTTEALTGDAPFTARFCDLDGDGDLDIVTCNDASDTVSVLLDDGAGLFGNLRRWPVGSASDHFEPVDVDCCDFNGDQVTDLIVANHAADNVSLLMGMGIVDGVPVFAEAAHWPVGEAPWAVRCASVNDDTHPDIVSANYSADNVSVLINDGAGGVSVGDSYTVAVGDGPRAMAFCDVDGDLDLDVVTANVGGKSVTVLRNDLGVGLIDAGDLDLGAHPFGIACCELGGAIGADIVTANIVDDSVTVLFNKGGGSFDGPTRIGSADSPTSVACGDIDRDGKIDVITANLGEDNATLFTNLGAATFTPAVTVFAGTNPSSVSINQCSGAVIATFAHGVGFMANTCRGLLDLDGDGQIDLRDFAFFQTCFGMQSDGPCSISDLNGDGVMDWADHIILKQGFSAIISNESVRFA